MCVFQGEHSENLSKITENEEIFGLDDKIIGVGFFLQLFQLDFAYVGQTECKELFIFENGQPLTTPPPQVSFWAFRLTVIKPH